MIESRIKNQKVVLEAIEDYKRDYNSIITTNDLIQFSKFLAERLLLRAEDEDCYTIDMIEDITRININK